MAVSPLRTELGGTSRHVPALGSHPSVRRRCDENQRAKLEISSHSFVKAGGF
ncbi:hypothetical protein AZA_87248 [Nitrospirillum viridazoti Y2]|nr:hypothetical protein AZA_87248 [Nitrospirillum amazonense Y2]